MGEPGEPHAQAATVTLPGLQGATAAAAAAAAVNQLTPASLAVNQQTPASTAVTCAATVAKTRRRGKGSGFLSTPSRSRRSRVTIATETPL